MQRFMIKSLRLYFIYLNVFVLSLNAFAQHEPQFSQNMFNHLAVNPGFAGSSEMVNFVALNRQQWMGLDGAPVTSVFNVDGEFNIFGKEQGIGLSIIQDNIGELSTLYTNFNYSYKFPLVEGDLRIGAKIGFISLEIGDGANWITYTKGDESIRENPTDDNLIPQGAESDISLDLGIGAFYNNDNWYASLSVTHINSAIVQLGEVENFYYKRNVHAAGGYRFQIENSKFELFPSFFMKTDGVSSVYYLNANLIYNKKVWGGVSFRSSKDIIAMFGIELRNAVRIGYSYDYGLSNIRYVNDGTHEFMVNYSFELGRDKSKNIQKSVRFL